MSIPHRGRVVIVGAGPAGAASAVGLRQHGFEGEIVLIGDDPSGSYSRPPLSKAFLRGEVAREDLALGTADAEVRNGIRATRWDPSAQRVMLSDGESLRYDGLVLATGTAARRPPDPRVHVLETIHDAERIAAALEHADSAAVVGSGFLAYELASAARTQEIDTTLVIRRDALRARFGMIADILATRARSAGIRVVESTGGHVEQGVVVTAENTRIEADVAIAAIGSVPDVSLMPDASGAGFVVDEYLRLRPNVVAAGDIALIRDGRGALHRDATWTNALAQGAAAARSLLDDDAQAFATVPYGWTDVFGLEVKIAGSPPADHAPTVIDGDLSEDRALLTWPGGAAAVGYRIPVARLRALAGEPATLGA